MELKHKVVMTLKLEGYMFETFNIFTESDRE